MEGFDFVPQPVSKVPLPHVTCEADRLLERLALSGIPVPPAGEGRMDLRLNRDDEDEVESWLKSRPSDGRRTWIGVGPGSKMPAKKWPLERYGQVVFKLIQQSDVWPVVFGGPEDRAVGRRFLKLWGRGHNAAGRLSPRGSAAALRRCALYLGNDTGTMHLAAAAGTRCVGIFSSRDWPGKWDPYGQGHQVLRTQVECEGCGLTACLERRNHCLAEISELDVRQSCMNVLTDVALSTSELALCS
jgi:ADP-heptose:LPS heptosyltransferase